MTRTENDRMSEFGERLARMEVMIDEMRKASEKDEKERAELNRKLGELTTVLNQAKGARWAIVTLIGVTATISAIVTKMWPVFLRG